MIRSEPQLRDVINLKADASYESSTNDAVLLSAARYTAVGCDLTDTARLDEVLNSLDLVDGSVLFVAEVSMTYMDAKDADRVIKWASKFQNGIAMFLIRSRHHY